MWVNRSSEVESMNIGVIGTGDIGAVIVKKLRDAGYPVKMTNSKGPVLCHVTRFCTVFVNVCSQLVPKS
jgi:phosphoglycerate dehydrogenase-like enzyme